MLNRAVLGLSCAFCTSLLAAQVVVPSGTPQTAVRRTGAAPPSARFALGRAPKVDLGPIDDSVRDLPAPKRGVMRVGTSRAVSSAFLQQGVWQNAQDGTSVWRLAIQSDGAVGIRVHFKSFNVGDGQVWVHDTADPAKQIFGPYTSRGRNGNGDFWSEVVFADTVVVEYKPAAGAATGTPPFQIAQVLHLWQVGQVTSPRSSTTGTTVMSKRGPQLLRADSSADSSRVTTASQPNFSCMLDVPCYADHPEVNDAAHATAYVLFDQYQCTGTLLNAPNNAPLILTAGHCIDSQDYAQSMVAIFNAVNSTCQTGTFTLPTQAQLTALPQASGVRLLNYQEAPFFDGTDNYEVRNDIDYSLVLLEDFPSWSDVRLSGYSSFPQAVGTSVTSVSAPQGLFLKVAFGSIADTGYGDQFDNAYEVDQSNNGRIDEGSSGSGIFDAGGHLVGLLSTGLGDCNNPSPNGSCPANSTACNVTGGYYAWYTKFSAIYPYIRSYLNLPLTTPALTLPDDPNVFSATPMANIDSAGIGEVTLNYNAPSATTVEIHVLSPDGPLLTRTTPKGQAVTNHWVTDGMVFYLQDVSSNQSLTIQNTIATVTAHSSLVSLTADPPFILSTDGLTTGVATLTWQVPGARRTEIHIGSPEGTLFAVSGWVGNKTDYNVADGTTYVLCNTSAAACSAATTVASLTMHVETDGASVSDSGSASLFANPNPIIVDSSDSLLLGIATLSWNAPKAGVTELHVNAPDGPLFARGGSSGTAVTYKWVTNGMTFYLQDVTNGQPLTAANTLATTTVLVSYPPQ